MVTTNGGSLGPFVPPEACSRWSVLAFSANWDQSPYPNETSTLWQPHLSADTLGVMAPPPDFGAVESQLWEPPQGHFSETELDGLAAPVRRYLRASIENGAPLFAAATLKMRGRIRFQRRLPFRAREVLNPHRGFIWKARVASLISGSDHYVDGEGGLHWKLAGLATVVEADGPDVARSSALRAASEAIWLPTSLLPRFGVEWTADGSRICAGFSLDGNPIQMYIDLEPDGKPASVVFDRWGDPDGEGFGEHAFGGEFTSHGTFAGLTIPTRGSMGWHYGTEKWEGGFFRFTIDSVRLG